VIQALLTWHAVAAAAFGYLLGSIPFGLLLTKAAGLGDVRNIGSGNIGATNVLRTGNKGLAAATLLLDALKATVAVLIVHAALKASWQFKFDHIPGASFGLDLEQASLAHKAFYISIFAGFGALVGHIYPIWLGFKGGKGVATFIGAMLGFFWPGALYFCGVWFIVAAAFRYSSLAALAASVVTVIYALMLGERSLAVLLALMTALIFYKHEANIRRLIAGKEPKIGAKK
jgi:glycerol-3-phosphate acyltransferase PlsY